VKDRFSFLGWGSGRSRLSPHPSAYPKHLWILYSNRLSATRKGNPQQLVSSARTSTSQIQKKQMQKLHRPVLKLVLAHFRLWGLQILTFWNFEAKPVLPSARVQYWAINMMNVRSANVNTPTRTIFVRRDPITKKKDTTAMAMKKKATQQNKLTRAPWFKDLEKTYHNWIKTLPVLLLVCQKKLGHCTQVEALHLMPARKHLVKGSLGNTYSQSF